MIEPGLYQHYKGGMYDLLHEAYDCESKERLIVYKSLETGRVWVRKHSDFFSFVTPGTQRFRKIK